MRIAHVTDYYLPRLGGIEMHVHDLVSRLRLAGHPSVVVTSTGAPAGSDDVPVFRLPGVAGLPALGAAAQLDRIITSGAYDVVHVHMSLFSPLAWAAARAASVAGVPTVITMHSLPAAGGVLVPHALARLDSGLGPMVQWTGVGEAVAGALREALPGRTVQVLHNGIDPEHWRTEATRHPATIVSTMRLARRKRPAALLRTLAAVRDLLPAEVPLRAVIVGAGPLAAGLARTVELRGMSGWVELPGRLSRPEIQRLYADADVYLAPAGLESFGVAALEARCAGLAVVAMASGGVGEFVRNGAEGFLVDNDEEMARVATDLLTTPDRLRRLQEHNRRTEPEMTWTTVIQQHLATYGRMAAPARRTGSQVALSA